MSDPPQVHVVPETSSDDRMHELSDGCWCRPWNEFVMNSATRRNDWVITHKPLAPAAAVLPQPADPPACMTLGHEDIPATRLGRLWDNDEDFTDVTYCDDCARELAAAGVFGDDFGIFPPVSGVAGNPEGSSE